MKSKLLVLSSVVLLSSCYSYKSIDRSLDSFEQGERVKLILNDRKRKGRLLAVYNDTIMIKNSNRQTEWYAAKEVVQIKIGKFSLVKTILTPPATLYIIALGATAIFGPPSYHVDLNF